MKDARQIVVEALCKMERERGWSNLVFDSQLRKYPLGTRDSAFAGALFYGVLERMITLDVCIAAHSSVRLRKLSLPVHMTLRCGVYQLLYMDGVPDSAAVSESVELVRKLHQPKSAKFVNAVLRSFLRAGKAIPAAKSGTPEDSLSIEYSCPAPLVRMWLDGYGEEKTRTLLARSMGRPPMTVRVNTCKTTPATLAGLLMKRDIEASPDELVPDCLILSGTGAVQQLPEFRRGLLHVQDKSSQLCALALAPRPGMRVLDACAAPGGKAFTLAQLMENEGELVAVDLHEHRVRQMQERANEMGLSVIRTVAGDMSRPEPNLGAFHRVLCDVPCSGLGVIRRKPEIKYKKMEEFAQFPEMQYKILENSAQYCMVDGLLMYSTCTLNPAENIGVAQRFLNNHPEFLPYPLPTVLGAGWHRTLLDEWDADGFFMACFQRK